MPPKIYDFEKECVKRRPGWPSPQELAFMKSDSAQQARQVDYDVLESIVSKGPSILSDKEENEIVP